MSALQGFLVCMILAAIAGAFLLLAAGLCLMASRPRPHRVRPRS